jgi:membrane protein YqaA with SNARE-associated domain
MLINIIKPIIENPIFLKFGLLSLFLNSVLSSIIPFPPVLTSTLLLLSGLSELSIFIVMASGSIIGGGISYLIGYDGNKLFKLMLKRQKKEHYEKSFTLLNRYGWGIIMVSGWIPILGEIVQMVAGMKKYNLKKFIIAITVGKGTHAFAIVYFSNSILHYFNYFKF